MIKRVILDIDNTLIPWIEEYDKEINKILDELNIEYTNEDYNNILEAMSAYENEYYTFNKKIMLDYINQYTNKKYPIEFINNIIDRWANCVPDKIEKETIETLKYLNSKYELVILTDWFGNQQSNRLEKLDILKYFQKVYSAEKTKRKPFKEAFIQAIGNNSPEECIMIGDNLERDIKGALNAGLNAVYYNPNHKEFDVGCPDIARIEELTEIL